MKRRCRELPGDNEQSVSQSQSVSHSVSQSVSQSVVQSVSQSVCNSPSQSCSISSADLLTNNPFTNLLIHSISCLHRCIIGLQVLFIHYSVTKRLLYI